MGMLGRRRVRRVHFGVGLVEEAGEAGLGSGWVSLWPRVWAVVRVEWKSSRLVEVEAIASRRGRVWERKTW